MEEGPGKQGAPGSPTAASTLREGAEGAAGESEIFQLPSRRCPPRWQLAVVQLGFEELCVSFSELYDLPSSAA